jgi:hypothetical protein
MAVDKLRVAVVFSGRATCYDESYEWFDKLSDKYDVDFYCSISTELDEYYQKFVDLYKIKKYIFGDMQAQEQYSNINIRNRQSMFYNLKLAVDLVPLDDYDVILYARADIVCTEDIDLSASAQRHDKDNVVFIPSGYDYEGVNDQMAFGTPAAMFKYSRVYDNIEEYLKYGFINEDVHPETTLNVHIVDTGLKVQRFDLNYSLNPKRWEYEINKALRLK